MSLVSSARKACVAALACVGLLGAVAPAQSAVVVSFDPAYGVGIPNLGFKGTATLDVKQDCYSLGSGFHYIGAFNDSSCAITVVSAEIQFYNTNLGPNSVFATASLLGPFNDVPLSVFGAFFDVDSGELTGIDTEDSPQFIVSLINDQANPENSVNYVGDMVLWFSSGQMPPTPTLTGQTSMNAVTSPGVDGGGARLATCQAVVASGFCARQTVSNLASATFTNDGTTGPTATVPEPGSLLLSGLALAAAAAASRRRAR